MCGGGKEYTGACFVGREEECAGPISLEKN